MKKRLRISMPSTHATSAEAANGVGQRGLLQRRELGRRDRAGGVVVGPSWNGA
jgi:hypothetical protein